MHKIVNLIGLSVLTTLILVPCAANSQEIESETFQADPIVVDCEVTPENDWCKNI